MAFEFNLPDIGEGVTEGEVVSWLIAKGDTVTEDQPIVEVMTDKATVEIASPKNGTIAEIMAAEGETVLVGKPLVLIEQDALESKTETTQSANNAQKDATQTSEQAPEKAKAPDQHSPSSAQQSSATMPATQAHILASPLTRKTAREMGLDINTIDGSGPSGRVTMEDVQQAGMGAPSQSSPQPLENISSSPAKASVLDLPQKHIQGGRQTNRFKVKGIRKKIVENMRKSLDHAAHFSHMDEIDATLLVEARNRLKGKAADYGIKLNYLPFIIKALVETLKMYPRLNATFDEDNQEVIEKYYYNIGVAVATGNDDLVVPVIHDADQKGLLQLASEIKTLADKAQNNKLSPGDFADGTFTVTSLGAYAGTYATPIINYPEMGILGFYKIEKRPVVIDDEIKIRQMANISFSLDHRIVDGYLGARFTKTFIGFLEQPEMLLMF